MSMDAVKFLAERQRMCGTYDICEGCALHKMHIGLCPKWCFEHPEEAVAAVEKWAKEHPPAEIGKKRRAEYKIVKILTDVAPVVRCKDCKHLVAVNVNGKGISTCRVSGMEVAPDEFCSRGEKGRR